MIQQIPCNNYNVGPFRMDHVIIHGTAGGTSAEGIAHFFQSTEGGSNPVCSHYIIGTDGVVVQCVDESNGAWANGSPEWNDRGISIEHVKNSTDNSDQLTPKQALASFTLINEIIGRWNIPIENIIPHSKIYATACPGPYPWDELNTFLAPLPITPTQRQRQAGVAQWISPWLSMHEPSPPTGTGIFNLWLGYMVAGHNLGPPISWEYDTNDWNGNVIIAQEFARARCEWVGGSGTFYDENGIVSL